MTNSDEYTEINSLAPNYDSAYLEKLKMNCQSIAEDTMKTRNSAYLVASNSMNGLMFLNQLGQFNQNTNLVQQQQSVQPNVYYTIWISRIFPGTIGGVPI